MIHVNLLCCLCVRNPRNLTVGYLSCQRVSNNVRRLCYLERDINVQLLSSYKIYVEIVDNEHMAHIYPNKNKQIQEILCYTQ